MTNETEGVIRVSVSEAARLFGVSSKTIRRGMAESKILYIIVRGRYKISFASLVTWSQQSIKTRTKRDRDGIGQWVEQWHIRNTLYSPRLPKKKNKNSSDKV
ncbi:hypothetical protein COX00_00595 [Candidatus Uhrbacteria bacterium CG22_combo_CG10-13_8_21_14_all_47_17]|uniref:Helix-turn-helix domain-containing protein n=1 Tax=Candidatus Uhrbacteria bacterium CG22_combo_CG10-13_8_21_14_all_47_17 TaxID=1975041 RepID=A0A2H0BTA0_9BACT|nr:MAG: hypothetical protein COX00_00595 [Candidatus Uhrbacteria bacterium CG22_combo_CG10-13_8_21_14_all_47_17]